MREARVHRRSCARRGCCSALDAALHEVLQVALGPFHAQYEGVHPKTLEPVFSYEGRDAIFEELPRGARHLVAIVTGATRALHGAYVSHEDPKSILLREGVVLVDDLEAQQDAALLKHLGMKVPRQRASTTGTLTEAELKIAHLVQQATN